MFILIPKLAESDPMTIVQPTFPVLASRLPFGGTLSRTLITAVVGSLAIAVSARIAVPFYPVPLTMQTFVVLALGMALGWRLAAATYAAYLLEGLLGLPVFAGTPEHGIGLAYMVGPTGGYLLGMGLAAMLTGWLAERGWDRTPLTTALAMVAGNAVNYGPGLLWLGTVIGWDKPVLSLGFTPFVVGDLLKIALAAAVMPGLWRLAGTIKEHQA